MTKFSSDVLIWTYYFEKPGKRLDRERLAEWATAAEDSFLDTINAACDRLQIPQNKAHRSQILALSVITRGSALSERVGTAARFYKAHVLKNELL